jgi:hypothetical protein
MKKLWEIITWPFAEYKRKKQLKKKMEELRKRDPFIYK